MKFYDKAQGYFETHPATDEFHFTSDGLGFFTQLDAEAHARSLSDRNIETIKRGQEQEQDEDKTNNDNAQANAPAEVANVGSYAVVPPANEPPKGIDNESVVPAAAENGTTAPITPAPVSKDEAGAKKAAPKKAAPKK